MAKLTGNLRITAVPASEGVKAHFEVLFVPYAGRLNTRTAEALTYDDLVALLSNLKFGEDDATRWAGKARSQGVVLISSFERNDTLLREYGLLA
ncbi:MAG TPA: hypothetical protein VIM62_04760 [Acidobacteriaceae bacterium]